jgi:hypothetical protein
MLPEIPGQLFAAARNTTTAAEISYISRVVKDPTRPDSAAEYFFDTATTAAQHTQGTCGGSLSARHDSLVLRQESFSVCS